MAKEIIYHCDGCETLINPERFIVELKVQEEIEIPVGDYPNNKQVVKQLKVDLLHACKKCYERMTDKALLNTSLNAKQQSVEN